MNGRYWAGFVQNTCVMNFRSGIEATALTIRGLKSDLRENGLAQIFYIN